MKISEKDKETIKKMRKKHKFLKGFTDEEAFEMFLNRCDNCFNLCFSDDLAPIMNLVGEVYKCCEKCAKIVLDGINYSKEDYELQYIEDSYYDKL